MNNIYISEATLNDVDNDQNVLTILRTPILRAIALAQDFEKKGALAFNDSLLTDVIEKLDTILAESINPTQEQLDQASRHFIERNSE